MGMVDKVPYEYIIKIYEDCDEYQPDNYDATVNLICAPGNHFRCTHDKSPHNPNIGNIACQQMDDACFLFVCVDSRQFFYFDPNLTKSMPKRKRQGEKRKK